MVESTANRAEPDDPEPGRLASLYLNEPLLAAGDLDARIALPAWVADALQLRSGMTAVELNRLRRTFALAHHPDRAGALHCDDADRRMMIANMLIDQALAGKAS